MKLKEKVSIKDKKTFEVSLVEGSVLQNINLKFSHMMASTSKPNLTEEQGHKISSEENIPAFKDKMVVEDEDLKMFLVEKSVPQYINSISENYLIASTSESSSPESQEYETSSEENIPDSKEKIAFKEEDCEVFLVNESVSQNMESEPVDYLVASTSESSPLETQKHKVSSEEHNPASKVSNEIFNIGDSKSHRQNVHYSSESSDYETDDSTSSDEFFENLHKNMLPSQLPAMKTKGELLIEDLPPVEDLDLNVNATDLQKMGKVLHSVISKERNEYLVVVASDGDSNPIDADSVLFLPSGTPLGKIYDVFGNVSKPYYTVRFNKAEDITDKGVAAAQDVYYSPENNELTRYVLVNELKQQKGSDASWKDNNEPPDDQVDYSDDEQEKLAKQKRRAKNRRNDRNWNNGEEEDVVPNKMERRKASYNQEKSFHARNKFQSPAPSASRSRMYSSPKRFNSTPPLYDISSPGPSDLQRNAISPQPFGRASPTHRIACFPRGMPPPQTFNHFSHNNVPISQPFGTFTQSRVPLHQHFTASNVSIPPNFGTGAPQHNSLSIMAAPQNTVPLQQQFLLQSQQPVTNFLSQPPPNYHSNQNSRTFTPPMFGAPPSLRTTLQNVPHHSPLNQISFPFGANGPHTNLSGNINISQPGSIAFLNTTGQQVQSYNMVQHNTFAVPQFPPANPQHNNMRPQFTQPIYVLSQSPIPSPCPTPPFALCQTPPPTIQPFAMTLPAGGNPLLPQNYPFC